MKSKHKVHTAPWLLRDHSQDRAGQLLKRVLKLNRGSPGGEERKGGALPGGCLKQRGVGRLAGEGEF